MQKTNNDWNKIYTDLSPKLLGICRRYIADLHNAEDIVQDSFMVAMQKNDQLKDEKAIFGWLKKIVVNNALQFIRKTSRDAFITTEPSEIPDNIFTEMTTSAMDEKKHIFAYDFTREELLQSIDSLPSHHKSVFNLYYIENYSHAEISSLLEIPVNTSKSHLMRAKKSIQNYLVTHFVNNETPKNKTAQLLVFFGFGGLLWAQNFQNKFSDFTISPSKNFEIPSEIGSNTTSISQNKNLWKQKSIIGTTLFIIIVGFILFFNPKNSFIQNFNSDISTLKSDKKIAIADQNKLNIEDEPPSHKEQENIKTIQKSISENNKNLKAEKQSTKTKNLVSSKPVTKKDPAETVSHKVIVVKKIIQRDTVFIER